MEEGSSPWPRERKVALVHDFLARLRGAERVFLAMCDALAGRRHLHRRSTTRTAPRAASQHRDVRTSFLQRLRPRRAPSARCCRSTRRRSSRSTSPATTSSISSSSAWAHAVICDEQTVHVSYCHNPFRYAWNERHRTLAQRVDPLSRAALARPVPPLAPVGLDRGAAGGQLPDQLAHHAGADQRLLRARLDGRVPAGRDASASRPGRWATTTWCSRS